MFHVNLQGYYAPRICGWLGVLASGAERVGNNGLVAARSSAQLTLFTMTRSIYMHISDDDRVLVLKEHTQNNYTTDGKKEST